MSSVYGLNVPNDWEVVALDQIKSDEKKALISGPFGSNISAKYFTPTGVPVIRGNNLSLDVFTRFKENGFVFVSPEKADELGTWAQADDIIFTAVGTLGQIGLLSDNQDYPRYIISNKQIRLRLNQKKVTPQFVYYWLASDLMQEVIEQRNTGSSVPLINLGVVKNLLIPLPPLPEQKAIASVLSSLDDKIDLLHRQNKTLEAMAETLFRQWFIEEAKEDWEEASLGSLFTISSGKGLKREQFRDHGLIPVLGANGEIGRTDQVMFEEFLIYTGRVGTLGKVSIIEGQPVWLSDNTLVFRDIEYFYFTYFQLKAVNYQEYNVGSTQPLIRQSDIKEIAVLLPSDLDMIKRFELQAKDIFGKIQTNTKQIQTLENLRNTLLPKLMSGEVRVQYQTEQVA